MAQKTTGIRAVLSFAPAYSGFQRLVGDNRFRTFLAEEIIEAGATDRVLDIGCGPGSMLPYVAPATYTGIDPSEEYIESARAKLGEGGTFHVGDTSSIPSSELDGPFTVVLAIGVLHHLDDDQVLDLAEFARQAMGPDGRFISADPCLEPGQRRIARELILRDRGQNVRDKDATVRLLGQIFDTVSPVVRHDLLRMPYTHVITTCQ